MPKVNIYDIIRGELIGCRVKVSEKNIVGRVIDETKNLLVIETSNKRRKKVIKKDNIFEFILNKDIIKIDGNILAVRPEDRIRIGIKKIKLYT